MITNHKPMKIHSTHWEGCWTVHHDCAKALLLELAQTVFDISATSFYLQRRELEIKQTVLAGEILLAPKEQEAE